MALGHAKFADGGAEEIASKVDIMFIMSFDDQSLIEIVTKASKHANKDGLILVGMPTVHPDVTDQVERLAADNGIT